MNKLSISNKAVGTLVVLVLVALTLFGLLLVARSYKAVHPKEVVAPKAAVMVCPTPVVQYVVITATPAPTASPSATVRKPTLKPTVVVTP